MDKAALDAVIFDWGGTLSKWALVDLVDVWRLAARHLRPDDEDSLVRSLIEVELRCWARVEATQESATLADILRIATEALGMDVADAVLEEAAVHHLDSWTPHIEHDPDAVAVLSALRERGLRIGLLSNTFWPRMWHEDFLERDGLLDLIDERVYTSDLPFTKPHPTAFKAVLEALELEASERVLFVGDRLWDDIHGAASVGMRTALRKNPNVAPYEGARPDVVIDALPELLPFIDSRAWEN
jgi:putative hydrolase of the HAD superfamily